MFTALILLFTLTLNTVYAATPVIITHFEAGDEAVATLNDDELDRTIDKVPLFNQGDYPNVPYGNYGSIASHGCGIVSLAMVATYLTDEFHSPVDLAKRFGHYNTERGSYWSLFEDTSKVLGLGFQEQTYSWSKVKDALANGQVVVALQGRGLFTGGGHYIVLTGLTEDGKIMVNDPNGNNWMKDKVMIEGFMNGFTDQQITENGGPYWIYDKKPAKDTTIE